MKRALGTLVDASHAFVVRLVNPIQFHIVMLNTAPCCMVLQLITDDSSKSERDIIIKKVSKNKTFVYKVITIITRPKVLSIVYFRAR